MALSDVSVPSVGRPYGCPGTPAVAGRAPRPSRGPPPNGAPSPRPPPPPRELGILEAQAAAGHPPGDRGRVRGPSGGRRARPRSNRDPRRSRGFAPTNSMARSLSAPSGSCPRGEEERGQVGEALLSPGSRIAPASTEARTTTIGNTGPFRDEDDDTVRQREAAPRQPERRGRRPAGPADAPAWRAPRRQRSGRGPSRQPCAWRHYTGSSDRRRPTDRYRSRSASTGAKASRLSSVFGSSQSCTWLMPSRA